MKIFGASERTDSFSFELSHSKSKFIEKLEEKLKNQESGLRQYFKGPGYIQYSRFKIEEERIAVKSISKSRSAPIYVYLDEIPGGRTTLRLEQENSVGRSKTILAVFSVLSFVLLLVINLSTGGESIGVNLIITLIPLIICMAVLAVLFYLLEKVQKYALKRFAQQIVRALDQD